MMNRPVDNGGAGGPRRSSSMRKLLTDGSPNRFNTPAPSGGKPPRMSQYIIPAVLVLALIVGVGILAFSFGSSRGKSQANAERDRFYESRASSWQATATAQAANPLAPGQAPGATSGFNFAGATYARIDRVEGEKVTVLLLNAAGQPTGTTLVLTLSRQVQIWRSIPSQPAEMRAGDSILFVGQRSSADSAIYEVNSVLVLPPNS